jgi:hypothetical protein
MAIHNHPVWQREYSYAEGAFFSGTDSTFSANGMSGLFDDLSGIEDHYYVIWGWQSVYIATATEKKHLILELEDEDNKRIGLMHASDDDNTVVMLPQPIRMKTGSGVYWEVLDTDMGNGDSALHEVFYSIVRQN